MKIIIEVGNPEQKRIMEDELRLIEKVASAFEPPLNINQVIVPENFDNTVNEIQNTNDYKSVRGVVALAKILETEDRVSVIISPRIYTVEWDIQRRAFIYLHEIQHLANKRKILKPEIKSPSSSLYFENIYRLFDEYVADRQALELVDGVFPTKSELMQSFILSDVDGFARIINNLQYYEQITGEIASFRIHQSDVERFLKNTHDSFSEVAMSVVHFYSYIDNYPVYQSKSADLCNSKFVNNRTTALIDFFRNQYTIKTPQLVDGLNIMSEFMVNFGMRFEDTTAGLYCHVIDI